MKVDIQKHIQGCLRCQLQKIIRNPLVITDTPTTALKKISMNIVGPLPETNLVTLKEFDYYYYIQHKHVFLAV